GGFGMLRRHSTPTVNFNRPWSDYKMGFGNMPIEYWLGLDNIHFLTQDYTYRLTTSVFLQNGTKLRSRQRDFQVGNESTLYKMTFTNSLTGENDTLGDCMEEMKNQPFSTYDNDNDNDANVNCAQEYHGGYWFDACSSCNPTGEMIRPASGYLLNQTSEVFWKKNLGDLAPYNLRQNLV
ncbi:ficolin-1-like, partial [Patella vulgata]|uniref:ficolin-1-like n=1 Tax=Patella vulgata TaxID=6465 RepID=UPI00217FAAA5